jgi:serine/threonine protein kinase/Flp pilus assembly protein TadD
MALTPGSRLGPYEILAPLGTGGMGEVYRARDKKLDRDVAIKVLSELLAGDPDALGRFEREAKAVAALSHPNILSIFDFGNESGVAYAVMELLEGETLRGKLASGPIPQKRAVDYALQIARGLSAAHEKEIVHRDLKPENLFITKDGHLKILDFGLAKRTERVREGDVTSAPTQEQHTEPGTVMGTVSYMSPEQVRGLDVDHRSDIFSFGAILYEMLSGKRAFMRDTASDTMAAIMRDEPAGLSESGRNIPLALDHIVRHCLEKDRNNRFESARDIAFDLSEASGPTVTSGVQISTPPTGKRKALIVTAAFLVLAAVSALIPAVRNKVAVTLKLRPVPADKRLAILPFRAAGNRDEDRALADGLSDLLTVRLTQLERFQKTLSVEPTSNIRQAGVTSADKAARALGATLVVSGSVQRLGERLVFTGSLEDARRNRTLRADSAESLEELIDKVVRMLDLEIGSEAKAAVHTSGSGVAEAAVLSAQALGYTPYAEGRSALERVDDAKSLERAIELFNKALELDPRYALAHAGIGEAYWRLYRATRKAEYVPLAREHCERALALDGLLAPAWLALGIIETGTGAAEKAVESFKKALDRNPRSGPARRELGSAYEKLGRFEEARSAYDKAIELRPDDWTNYSHLGAFLAARDRPKEAEAAFRSALRIAPDNPKIWSNLGGALYLQNRMADAKAAFAKSIALFPTPAAIANLGYLQFLEGRYADAARTLEKATQGGTRDYKIWWNLASALFWAPREREQAAAAYRKTAELGEEERKLDPRNPSTLIVLADCYAYLEQPQRARSTAAEALRIGPVNGAIARAAAGVYEQLGDRAEALRWVGEALKAGYGREEFERDPAFRKLKADPRYAAMIAAPGS